MIDPIRQNKRACKTAASAAVFFSQVRKQKKDNRIPGRILVWVQSAYIDRDADKILNRLKQIAAVQVECQTADSLTYQLGVWEQQVRTLCEQQDLWLLFGIGSIRLLQKLRWCADRAGVGQLLLWEREGRIDELWSDLPYVQGTEGALVAWSRSQHIREVLLTDTPDPYAAQIHLEKQLYHRCLCSQPMVSMTEEGDWEKQTIRLLHKVRKDQTLTHKEWNHWLQQTLAQGVTENICNDLAAGLCSRYGVPMETAVAVVLEGLQEQLPKAGTERLCAALHCGTGESSVQRERLRCRYRHAMAQKLPIRKKDIEKLTEQAGQFLLAHTYTCDLLTPEWLDAFYRSLL